MARKKSKSQIWLEYVFARVIIGFFGILPRKAAVGLGILTAKSAYPFLGGLRRTGLRSLEIAFPAKGLDERERILKKSFQNLGRILGEVSQFPRATPEKLARMIDFQFDTEESINSEERKVFEADRAAGRVIDRYWVGIGANADARRYGVPTEECTVCLGMFPPAGFV